MNTGGIARRLVNLAQALVGRLPGSLAHCNILANTLFGAISGSAVASAAAVGGIMSPLQEKEGYSPAFSTAINVASAPIGLMIPPSNVLIVYSLASGGTSVAALFLAGYLPGILTALALMTVAALYAHRHHYPVAERINLRQFLSVFRDSLPSLLLIFIIIGGIIGGVFTPTEASAIAVIYSLALAAIYREINVSKLRDILLDSVVTSSIVLLLVGCSMGMSWAMTNADVPELINEMITSVSEIMGHLADYQSHFVTRRDVYGYYPGYSDLYAYFPSHCSTSGNRPCPFWHYYGFQFNHRTVYAPGRHYFVRRLQYRQNQY